MNRRLIVTFCTLCVGQFVVFGEFTAMADTCAEIGDPAGQFLPDSFCIPTDPGDFGSPATIHIANEVFTVSKEKIDIILPMAKGIARLNTSNYSTTLTWTTPVEPSGLRMMGRLVAFPNVLSSTLIDTDAADVPDSFSWLLNDENLAIGWQVLDKQDSNLSDVTMMDHYHTTTHGLPLGEAVTFSHDFSGGIVVPVPESSTSSLLLSALTVFVAVGRRGILTG